MLNEKTRSLQIIDDNEPSLYGISEIHVYPDTYKIINCILEGATLYFLLYSVFSFNIQEPTNVNYISVSSEGNLTINQFPYSTTPVTVKVGYSYKNEQRTDSFTLISKYYELVNKTNYIFYEMPDFTCTDGPPDISTATLTFTGELSDMNKLKSRNDFMEQIPEIREYSVERFYMIATGYVSIPSTGIYTFTLSTPHGSKLTFFDTNDNYKEIPILSYWGSEACKANNPVERKIINLNEQIYGFRLEVYGVSRYGFSFTYKYENRKIEEEEPLYYIPFQSNTKQFNLLRSIQFPHSHYIFSYNSYNTLQFSYLEGYSDSCKIINENENLPFNLQLTNSTIEGIPNTIISEEKSYQIVCESEYSKTSIYTLYIKILNNYRKGSLVKYMKIIGFDSSCSTPYNSEESENNNYIQILTKRIETPIGTDPVTDISLNNDNSNIIKNGLSSDFISNFAINYDGYLKLDDDNLYGFELNSTGGSWLYINNQLIIDNSGNYNNNNIAKTKTKFEYFNSGYYHIKLIYVKTVGPFILKFNIKLPNNDRFEEAQEYLYYVPPSTLFYHSPMIMTIPNHLTFKNSKIFIVNEEKQPIEFELDGDLPQGLVINSKTGQIKGYPVETTGQAINIGIKGKYSDNTEYKFEISISVSEFDKPTDVSVHNRVNGEEITVRTKDNTIETNEISMQYGYFVNIEIDCSYGTKWNLIEDEMKILDGLSFNEYNHTITGYPRCASRCNLIKQGNININISNEKGFKLLKIKYDVVGGLYLLDNSQCVDGNLHMFIVNGTYNNYDMIYITLLQYNDENELVEIIPKTSYNTYKNPSILSYCLKGMKYIFRTEDNILSTNQITYSVYVNGYLIDSWSHYGTRIIYDYEIDTNLTAPVFNYNKNDLNISIPSVVYIKPTSQYGYINEMIITPTTIPYNLDFNYKNGIISGTAFTLFKTITYEIYARNAIGESKFKISLSSYNIGKCNSTHQNSLIINLLTDQHYYINMFVYLYNEEKEFSFEREGSNLLSNYYYQNKYCIKEGNYKLELKDLSSLNGWGESYVEIIFNNLNMGRWSINEGDKVTSLITDESEWEYFIPINTKPDNYLWYNSTTSTDTNNTHNKEWSKIKIPQLESIESYYARTRLILRYDLPYIAATNITFPTFYLYIEYSFDLVVYVNGIILNEDTIEREENIITTRYILPTELLVRKPPVLGIEIFNGNNHIINFAHEILKIRLYELNSDTDCILLNHQSGRIIDSSQWKHPESNGENNNNYDVKNGFDDNTNTQWSDLYENDGKYESQSYAVYDFGERNYYFINNITYRISSNYDKLNPSEKPKDIILYSKPNSTVENYNIISDDNDIKYQPINSEILQASNSVYSPNFLDNIGNIVMVNISKINLQNQEHLKMTINDIDFRICHRYFCSELYVYNYTLPVTQSGKNFTVNNCPFSDLTGYNRTFYCSIGRNPTWTEVDNNCPTKPYLITQYYNHITYIAGNRYNDKLFELSGYKMKIRVNPILPYYLQISNDSIGWVLGQVNDTLEMKEYTFTVWNDYGETDIFINIEVVQPDEPKFVNISGNPIVFYAGTLYKNERMFHCIGKNLTFRIDPQLPSNLIMDSSSGLVNGIPELANENDETANYRYNVIATNPFGMAVLELNIIIKEPDYLTLRKLVDNYTFYAGFTYTNIELIKATGINKRITITPNLPDDLKMDVDNGLINGVVDVDEEEWIDYKITSTNKQTNEETNSNNTITVEIKMNVVLLPYPVIQFIYEQYTFYMGELYADLSLFIIKGRNMEYFVSPALPEGLLLNRYTGKISGRLIKFPNERERDYLFTFENPVEKVQATIKLTYVYRDYPVVVTYNEEVSFIHGEMLINRNIFTVVGEGLHYSVKPQLPPVLLLSSNLGSISGLCRDKTAKSVYNFEIVNLKGNSINLNISIEIINQYCKRDGEWEETEANTENEKSCGKNKVGLKYRKCKINSNNEAYWEKEFNNCNFSSELVLSVTLCTLVVGLIIIGLIVYILIKKRKNYEMEVRNQKDNRILFTNYIIS